MLAFCIVLLISAAVYFCPLLFTQLGFATTIVGLSEIYARALAFNCIPMAMLVACYFFCAGNHHRRWKMATLSLFTLPLNASVNYVLIFAQNRTSESALFAAGLATVMAAGIVSAILVIACLKQNPRLKVTSWLQLRPQFRTLELHTIYTLLRSSLSATLLYTGAIGLFTFSTVVAGALSSNGLIAQAIVIRTAVLAYLIPFAIAQGVASRIASEAHNADRSAIVMSARTGLTLAIVVGLFYLCVIWAYRYDIVILFLHAQGAQEPVLAHAVLYLTILAILQPCDCASIVTLGILRGLNDSRIPCLFVITGYYGVGLSATVFFARNMELGLIGICLGVALGIAIVASATLSRLIRLWVAPNAPAFGNSVGTISSLSSQRL